MLLTLLKLEDFLNRADLFGARSIIALCFQPPLLTLDAYRVLTLATQEVSTIYELAMTFLQQWLVDVSREMGS